MLLVDEWVDNMMGRRSLTAPMAQFRNGIPHSLQPECRLTVMRMLGQGIFRSAPQENVFLTSR